jgi:hypothetical protein
MCYTIDMGEEERYSYFSDNATGRLPHQMGVSTLSPVSALEIDTVLHPITKCNTQPRTRSRFSSHAR